MNYEAYEHALAGMRRSAPELLDGGPNHGPMVVEALAVLGFAAATERWVQAYKPLVRTMHRTLGTIALVDFDWRLALGKRELYDLWESFFKREIADRGWCDAVSNWLPRLLPGTLATGTHALIRCAHIVRALQERSTELRLEELACALAYGASRYRTFVGIPELSGTEEMATIAAELPHVAPDIERHGPPPKVVMQLRSCPKFSMAVARAIAPSDIDAALLALSRLGVEQYLRNAERHPLVFGHAVTGPAALRLLLPFLPVDSRHAAFACMWQAVAAWIAAYGYGTPTDPGHRSVESWDSLAERSVQSADAHAIKFTEACRRESAALPVTTLYAEMATDWIDRVEASKTWTGTERIAAGIAIR